MSQKHNVIIIGAGLSGIIAARRLREHGVASIILEARDRVGGRVHSVPLGNGQLIDLGTSMIIGQEGNPLVPFVEATPGVRLVERDGELLIPRPGAQPLSAEDSGNIMDVVWEAYDEAAEQSREESDSVSDHASVAEFVDQYLDHAAKERKLDRDLLRCGSDMLTEDFGAELDDLSLKHIGTVEEYEGEDGLLLGGHSTVLRHAATKAVLDSVLLQHVVTSVDYTGDSVHVATANHGSFLADAVLITVPLGVLKANAIQFNPPLSAARQQAVRRTGFGNLNMVILEYTHLAKPFWPMTGEFSTIRPAEVETDHALAADILPRPSVYFANYQDIIGYPALAAYLPCALAEYIEKYTDEQVADLFARHLKRYFPAAPDTQPTRCLVSRWVNDPFSRGSYSYVAVGGDRKDFDILATPCQATRSAHDVQSSDAIPPPVKAGTAHQPVLFWAGEHTETNRHSYAHGALLSGERAAGQLLSFLGVETHA
ncbi:amine oxidase [Thamnocephalis sphaerospora]|uniref:Amine oxidase n=1 Tax=Thamnocephalis sphaerospora TaxID=78915 RepID=A0A4P9XPA0_9FUNG|nr:amine oxidase [Thamnocephalis sphaerospora]|eukprot:RKP07806.1 amine oxidase [Thamnocephalis sphaerospora]